MTVPSDIGKHARSKVHPDRFATEPSRSIQKLDRSTAKIEHARPDITPPIEAIKFDPEFDGARDPIGDAQGSTLDVPTDTTTSPANTARAIRSVVSGIEEANRSFHGRD